MGIVLSPTAKHWKFVSLFMLCLLGCICYIIIFDKTNIEENRYTLRNQNEINDKSSIVNTESDVWSNKTLRMLVRLTNAFNKLLSTNNSEIVISRNILEGAKIFKVPETKVNFIPTRDVINVNCKGLITGSNTTLQGVKHLMVKMKRPVVPNSYFIEETKDCYVFRLKRGYILNAMTSEEKEFPIAFSILMFKDVIQAERLLRAIYRPQNYYCIHVDKKAASDVHNAIKGIASCFSNVFLTERSVDVRWGTFTVLEPDIMCMRELWKYRKWKYFINLTGQEFPLKTNFDVVRILKAYRGANDLEGTIKRANKDRWKNTEKPPYNITAVKGSVHIVASRGFVDYLLHNQTAKDLLVWVNKTSVPDETYFSSLNHNPHLRVPGSYKGEPETNSKTKPFLARFKNWASLPCAGKFVRGICIFGVGDLPIMVKRRELFANKFHLDFEPYGFDCIEEWHYNMTRDEYLGLTQFDDSYYKTVGFVTNQV